MIETLSIRELEAKADNIYEAIIVLAKRSRQINGDQKALLASERDYDDDFESFLDDEVAVADDHDYPVLPKPAALALDEFLSDKVQYHYQKTEEELAEAEAKAKE